LPLPGLKPNFHGIANPDSFKSGGKEKLSKRNDKISLPHQIETSRFVELSKLRLRLFFCYRQLNKMGSSLCHSLQQQCRWGSVGAWNWEIVLRALCLVKK